MNRVSAIVLSAGKGKRMNSDISKQYMEFNGKPIIYYTIEAFMQSKVDEIIIVTGKDDIAYVDTEILKKYGLTSKIRIVAGGKERFDSSYNGILAAKDSRYVLIHDGARPCITTDKINEIIDSVKKYNACIVGVPVKDTIKKINEEGVIVDTPARETLWQVQTPQAFDRVSIISAYEKMYKEGTEGITDDAMVMERFSDKKVKMIMGDYSNIKVTTPEDMGLLDVFLKK